MISLNRSQLTALAIFVAVVILFTIGTLLQGGPQHAANANSSEPVRFEVVTETIHAIDRPARLALRGRTEAFREVVVRSETGGRIVAAPAVEGTTVSEGDVLCRLDLNARGAALAQAEAEYRTRELDYNAAVELLNRGHRSANAVAGVEALRDAAQARLEAARQEVSNTNIRAPFDGYFDNRAGEIGDYLAPGAACGTVVQLDPILITAEVAERDVAGLAAGMPGTARLITGETVAGTVRFVERRADPATHTFRLELAAPNPDGQLRSGVTAEIAIPLAAEPAYRIPTSVLALNANGELGVRIVEAGDIVRFLPVELLDDDGEEVWVSGLPNPARVITVGQDFVEDGVQVRLAGAGAAE
ncbi:efflux RND transporter periplasmic adaptor subunit [uncultured Maricaulis sp.]|uniref:efflux RND transporter periplasmic adaptor subunit n=1 Tax=uncultured Maricaulis sp. TaxID=174710 RepID=UPI0030DB24C4|tara:strand:- start:89583 stop:90659 length:1077 start_codon:yes stop_codon:yes gene_type:complete